MSESRRNTELPAVPGLGTRCPEAQADGVPCPEICDCAACRPYAELERTFIDGAFRLSPSAIEGGIARLAALEEGPADA